MSFIKRVVEKADCKVNYLFAIIWNLRRPKEHNRSLIGQWSDIKLNGCNEEYLVRNCLGYWFAKGSSYILTVNRIDSGKACGRFMK